MTDKEQTFSLAQMLPSRTELHDRIDRLTVSADAKALLSQIVDVTALVGGKVVQVGRKIISFILETFKMFPNTAFGLIVGYVIATLIASIPFIGAVLGAFLGPLLIALGLLRGAIEDMKTAAIRQRVAALEAEFRSL